MALSNIKVNNHDVVGVDVSPVNGSRSLIESGGVYSYFNSLYTGVEPLIVGKECYIYNGTVYFSDNAGYMYRVDECKPGDFVQVYSHIGPTTIEYMYTISFWLEYPETSTFGEKCIMGVKASESTAGKLYLYSALAPAGTKYVVYSSSYVSGGGPGTPTGKGSIKSIESDVNKIKLDFLIEKRNNDIISCQNINISLIDLPHSSDGSNIENGFSYIDSNNNIKIKTN